MIQYLLKFGKKAHVEEFAAGILFCSNAATYWGIEKDLKIKGQGDILEAGSRMFAQKTVIQPYDTNEITIFDFNTNPLVHFAPAKLIPVFCLFAVYDDDCTIDEQGNAKIMISASKQRIIREHFPNADSVGIISEPEQFLNDITNSVGTRVIHEPVHYFHIDKGLEVNGGRQTAMDMEYLKYLTQDATPKKENGTETRSFKAAYVFRALLCKDVFFRDEQEYRIVLPDEMIAHGTKYPVKLSNPVTVLSLDEFFYNASLNLNLSE